eukprot:364590-Chlamydomonas_euryale.AAC.8
MRQEAAKVVFRKEHACTASARMAQHNLLTHGKRAVVERHLADAHLGGSRAGQGQGGVEGCVGMNGGVGVERVDTPMLTCAATQRVQGRGAGGKKGACRERGGGSEGWERVGKGILQAKDNVWSRKIRQKVIIYKLIIYKLRTTYGHARSSRR